jgi:hypothetical protein
MNATQREAIIRLGAKITQLRVELEKAEAELDRLVAAPPQPAPSPKIQRAEPNGAGGDIFSVTPQTLKTDAVTIPPTIGSLSDQAVAVLKANPTRALSGEIITDCLNRMPGRTSQANVDSVNAALSRLTTDGIIVRVERGLYKAKPLTTNGNEQKGDQA